MVPANKSKVYQHYKSKYPNKKSKLLKNKVKIIKA